MTARRERMRRRADRAGRRKGHRERERLPVMKAAPRLSSPELANQAVSWTPGRRLGTVCLAQGQKPKTRLENTYESFFPFFVIAEARISGRFMENFERGMNS